MCILKRSWWKCFCCCCPRSSDSDDDSDEDEPNLFSQPSTVSVVINSAPAPGSATGVSSEEDLPHQGAELNRWTRDLNSYYGGSYLHLSELRKRIDDRRR